MTTALLVWMGVNIGFVIGAWWAGSAKMSHTGAEAARGQAAVAKLGPRCPHADHRPPPLHL